MCVPSDCYPSLTVRRLGSSETNQIETIADGEILLGQAMLYITWNAGVGDGFRYVRV